MDTAGVQTSEGSSGVAVIVVSHDGENSIVVTSAANQKLTPHDLETHMQMIREAGLVLTKLETPVETVECLAHLRPRECAADPRSCPGERASNQVEAAFFTKGAAANGGTPNLAAVAQEMLNKGSHGVVLKMGEKGAYVASRWPCRGGTRHRRQLGGDDRCRSAFNGGVATALMLGKTPTESASFAAVVAGLSVTRSGAQSSMPSLADVNAFMNNQLRYV